MPSVRSWRRAKAAAAKPGTGPGRRLFPSRSETVKGRPDEQIQVKAEDVKFYAIVLIDYLIHQSVKEKIYFK
jgi:hypothetical protein